MDLGDGLHREGGAQREGLMMDGVRLTITPKSVPLMEKANLAGEAGS